MCQVCTAARPRDKEGHAPEPVTYPAVIDHRDYDTDPLPGPPEPQIL